MSDNFAASREEITKLRLALRRIQEAVNEAKEILSNTDLSAEEASHKAFIRLVNCNITPTKRVSARGRLALLARMIRLYSERFGVEAYQEILKEARGE